MSISPDESKAERAERRIIANRDPRPCGGFEAAASVIQLCNFCGWNEAAHMDFVHDMALEMDAERPAPGAL